MVKKRLNWQLQLILLDIMMPGIDVLEVCRLLQKSDTSSKIPVLFISGKTYGTDIYDGFNVGGVDFTKVSCKFIQHLAKLPCVTRS
jgi:DNA-binding response OmpR family regulator